MKSSYPTTWDLKPLLKEESEQEIALVREAVIKSNRLFIDKWQGRRDYLESGEVLKEALSEYENLMRSHAGSGCLGYYFSLRSAQDENDPEVKARAGKVDEFEVALVNELQFFTMRLGKVSKDKQREFLQDKRLQPYTYFLQTIFNEARYLLSEPEEKILNLKADVASNNWRKLTSGLLAKQERKVKNEAGEVVEATIEVLTTLIDSPVQAVRDEAAQALNEILGELSDVGEAELNSLLANKKIDDELRGFARPDQARHLRDDVETEVVDLLIQVVSERYYLAHRYYRLKANLLNMPTLAYHERNVQFGSINKKYTFDDSVLLVRKVFTKLDPQFAAIFQEFLTKGQFDIYPRKGKRGGAFCAYSHLEHPVYILLNHNEVLKDVLTLAHEMGHGINDELSRQHQNALNYGTSTYTAEVASTFMEDFVLEELLSQADDEERLALMMMKLNDDISTIFRQVACYQFEQELHRAFREKGYLSKDSIGALFQKAMGSYLGEAVALSPGSENWWIYWQHIRMYFYVYSYASGLLISKSLQSSVRKDPKSIEAIKKFLASGRSDSPSNLFKALGFNLKEESFWIQGLQEVEHLLSEAELLAKKMGKV